MTELQFLKDEVRRFQNALVEELIQYLDGYWVCRSCGGVTPSTTGPDLDYVSLVEHKSTCVLYPRIIIMF